ncbi:protein LAZ1 homolog 2 [Impatiens glandulifera]|uniref:protein LAZ1 homolog 2 n=1 Tax=Impatiens glandulifera TaxID=253017 RepID=UPI001FB0E220|nr:protein LAZ1 homolog 2 [Impatiens glandulifera]
MHFVSLTFFSMIDVEDGFLHHNAYRYLHRPALIFAACLVLVSLLLSIHLIFSHLRSYTKPAEQKWIVAVLLIVPIYATESIVSLWNPRLSLVCDILRNCYEAFALYSFGSYLIACLGGERRVVELLEDESRKMLNERLLKEEGEVPKNPKAFCNFFRRPCLLGKDLLNIEKFGLVQYMILKTLCAFLAFILELFDVYGDGEFKWYYGYPYMAVVLNFSQMWALYCLVQFYNVTHETLRPIKPLAKFISFKAIVFATWWQGVGIALLCSFGVLPKEEKIQTGLQDFLICIEMAVAAVAHIFVFPVKPYRSGLEQQQSDYGKIISTRETIKAASKEKEGKGAVIEKKETEVKCPGTSVKESIQDIVVGGGQHVVKDVVLTINQAIEPVEKGVTKIQETFHQRKVASDNKKEETAVEEHVQKKKKTVASVEEEGISESSSSSSVAVRRGNEEEIVISRKGQNT